MILLVHSFPGANDTFERHFPYFLKSGASRIVGIGTLDGSCKFPASCEHALIGHDSYISGRTLPQRLVDTLKYGLKQNDPHICVCEYDTLFFHALPVERMEHAVAAHYAGGPTWGSKATGFYHNPFLFRREAAQRFTQVGQDAINSRICDRQLGQADPPEASPDVFVGFVVEKYEIPIHGHLWKEYSRNSLDVDGHLEEARQAYRDGATVVHGVKSKRELNYILS